MARKKKRDKNQRKNEITKGIFTVLEKDPKQGFNYKQIASKLEITDTEGRNILIKRLGQLKDKKRIKETNRGRYSALFSPNHYTGTVDLTARGNAYVIVEELENDIFIPEGTVPGRKVRSLRW